jgi:hypothetical protein
VARNRASAHGVLVNVDGQDIVNSPFDNW